MIKVKKNQKYFCNIHGNIGNSILTISIKDKMVLKPTCVKCIAEFLDENIKSFVTPYESKEDN